MKGWFYESSKMKNKKIKDNFCVYEALRNEIISFQQIHENLHMAVFSGLNFCLYCANIIM